MYVIKNAFKNLNRNKGRNFLIGSIIFVLILAITVSMVINITSNNIIKDYKSKFGSKVTIALDYEKLGGFIIGNENENDKNFPKEITQKQYVDFSKSKYLKSYNLKGTLFAALKGLKAVGEDEKNENGAIGIAIGDDNENFIEGTVNIYGEKNISNNEEFKEGKRKLTKGTFYKNKNECIVSEEFAKLNNLKVGSYIEVINSFDKNQTLKLKVVGIYFDSTKEYGPMGEFFKSPSMNKRNDIFVNFDTLYDNFKAESINISASYQLKSPENLDKFEKELRNKGLDDGYKVSTDSKSYNKIVKPVEGLTKITNTFMWLVFIIGVSVLLILSFIAIRERKYEIGVLRAMGMKKKKLASMFIIETVFLTIISLLLGLSMGTLAAQPIADNLIKQQVESIENSENNSNSDFSSGFIMNIDDEISDYEMISKIDVSLSKKAIINITGIAILIALITSSIAIINITKYEPMKILSERN